MQTTRQRKGVALILVLVVSAMIALAAYRFADVMISYATHARTDHRYVIERSLAESAGATVLAAIEARESLDVSSTFGVKELIAGKSLLETRDGRMLGKFSVYFQTAKLGSSDFSIGLEDESSKLNLHSLPLNREQQSQARVALMHVPGLTAQVADSILDWIDADDEPRPFGAESSYYSSLPQPYEAANRRLKSLDELLKVRGVTKQMLHGQSTRNDSTKVSDLPSSPAWDRYLTIDSRECNTSRAGAPRINLNDPQLDRVYDQVASKHSTDLARFVIALRLAGPMNDDAQTQKALSEEDEIAQAEARIKQQLMDQPSAAADLNSRVSVTRGGMDLSVRPVHRVRSLADLWGTKVRVTIDGKDEVLASPWKENSGDFRKMIAEIEDTLSTHSEATVEGRINVNIAPQEVLRMIPKMESQLANAIAIRQRDATGHPVADRLTNRSSIAWLLDEGLVSPSQLRELAPYLTCRGDVYKGFVACRTSNRKDAAQFGLLVDGANPHKSVRHLKYLGRITDEAILKAISLESTP
jgi:type II secretory pathway component PulK